MDGSTDRERAVAALAERLPERLRPLAEVAYNYRWAWLADGPALWESLYPGDFGRIGHNPRAAIEHCTPEHLRERAGDHTFLARVESVVRRTEEDANRPWDRRVAPEHPVAYFCSEYGLHSSLPLYGGGLGVLAGDTLKTASDLALPMVGVGLFYREGYFRQQVDGAGWQHEYWTESDFERLPVVRVTGPDQKPITVHVVVRGRVVVAQIWRVQIGRVPLFLLDTDHPDNHPVDRWITGRLYIGDRQTRLAQYTVLGIGGIRALEAMGIAPSLIHLNEGHAALGSLERLRRALAEGASFEEALARVRNGTVFTTHTPVAAGNEGYDRSEIEAALTDFLDTIPIPPSSVLGLARVQPANEREPVSMIPLALRTSRVSNGVSQLHGRIARGMWKDVWPGQAEENVPIRAVTNGVHVSTWMAPAMQDLFDRHLGHDWRRHLDDPELWKGIDSIPDAELWQVRCRLRAELVRAVREESIRQRLSRGEAPEMVEAAARVFEPSVLTIGFARRVATYKRMYLLTHLPERMARLIHNEEHRAHLIISGKAHPQDHSAKEVLRDVLQLKSNPGVAERVIFLEDYDMRSSPRLVAGVDLWINVPRPPLEASGTSGMKVVLNGGLNLSVLDGWWAEACDDENGWGIRSPDADPATQDDHDARALFDILESEVLPLFYNRGSDDIPRPWLRRVKHSMRSLIGRFSSDRMLREYADQMYLTGGADAS